VQRGARNRAAIVAALLELVGEGELEPTAEQVAERACVGTRTVFRHFADMESRSTNASLPSSAPATFTAGSRIS
jgi:AcrR family transcriptional regulator